ncbi:MAG: hypothetical protein ACLU4N_12795 [Butyricimonas faecihominis]
MKRWLYYPSLALHRLVQFTRKNELSFSLKNATLKDVISEIKRISACDFVYMISIDFNNETCRSRMRLFNK